MMPCFERQIYERFGLVGESSIYRNDHPVYKYVVVMAVMKLDYRCTNAFNTAGVQVLFGRGSNGRLRWQERTYCYEPTVEFKRDWSLEYHFTAKFQNWWDSVLYVLHSKKWAVEFNAAIKEELLQKVIAKEQSQQLLQSQQLVGE